MRFLLFIAPLITLASAAIAIKKRKPQINASLNAGTINFRARSRLSKQQINNGVQVTKLSFQLKDPSGTEQEWFEGQVSPRKNPKSRFFNFKAARTLTQPGAWEWRLEATDTDGTSKISRWFVFTVDSTNTVPPTKPPTEINSPPNSPVVPPTATNSPTNSPVAPPTATDPPIEAARTAIQALVNGDAALKAKFVRLGFHDCVGGCDGCVDLTNLENKGLEVPITALDPVVASYSRDGLTKADVWALAAMVGAESSQTGRAESYDFHWYGRKVCNENTVEDRQIPSADLNTSELLHFFSSNFGFNAQQTVALMGAHSIGTLSQENSGFTGPNGWDQDNRSLNNRYYGQLIGGSRNNADGENQDFETLYNAPNWRQRRVNNQSPIPDREQWTRGRNNDIKIMTNADIALVRDFSAHFNQNTKEVSCRFRGSPNQTNPPRCPHAAETFDHMAYFKYNNREFLRQFRDVFMEVLHHGSGVQWNAYGSPPCSIA